MDEYFTLLQFAISQVNALFAEVTETKTRIYAYDPLKELADRLKERLKACGWDIPEDLSPYGVPSAPSTSDRKGGVDVTMDTRIQYSAMLTLILNKLSSAIKQSARSSAESTTLLSVERIASITSGLQFYIPTAVLPYFDEGVGIAVEMRSKLIKYWQPIRDDDDFRRKQIGDVLTYCMDIAMNVLEGPLGVGIAVEMRSKLIKYWQPIRDDDDFRRKQLLSAAQTFARLTECCVQIKQLIVAKFVADFIALNEQLLRLNETSMKQQYEAFILREVRRPYLMYQLFFIMSPLGSTQNKSKPPPWLTISCVSGEREERKEYGAALIFADWNWMQYSDAMTVGLTIHVEGMKLSNFKVALGRRLSEMIIEADGIANLATALTQGCILNYSRPTEMKLTWANSVDAIAEAMSVIDWLWLCNVQVALGRRLSEMIIEADGIANLATALTQEGVDYFENWAFVRSLADVISRRPNFLKEGDSRRTLYHANILKQFIAVMQKHPAASKIAPWFAASVEAIAALVPRTVAICFTDSLLHPWEVRLPVLYHRNKKLMLWTEGWTRRLDDSLNVLLYYVRGMSPASSMQGIERMRKVLYHRNKKLMLWTEGWTRRLDDSLNVLLYYVRGMSPASSMQGIERMRKLFPLWLSLYGSAFSSTEEIADVERRNMCVAFTDDLCCLLTRILKDPTFDSDVQKAKFLVAQLAAEDIQMCVEFAFKALIVELNASNEVGSDKRKLKYEFVRIRALPDDNLELIKARMFENRVTAIVHLLKALDKNSGEELTLKVLAECVLVSRGGYSADDEEEDEDRFVSIEGHDHTSAHIQDRMRVQYLMGCLGDLLPEFGLHSEEAFTCIIDVAECFLDRMRVQYLMGCLGDLLPEFGLHSEEAFTCIVDVAEVILESTNEKLEALQMKTDVDIEARLKGEEAELADVQMKSVEMAVALAGAVVMNASESAKVKASLSSLGAVMQRFCVLVKQMNDAKREKFSIAFESAEKMVDILKCAAIEIPNQRINDSDNSTSVRAGSKLREVNVDKFEQIIQGMNDEAEAVRGHALIELAKCIRKRDRCILEAVERHSELMDLIMKKIADKDSYVYLTAIRAMAELAYWKRNYFDAMVEFFIEPNGRLSAVLSEMKCEELEPVEQEDFLLIQRVKVGEALGKVCKALGMYWIFTSFLRYIDFFKGLSSHLHDLNRHLRHLLIMDRDDGVRLLAELCLLDIKEQMDNAIRDLENSMVKRVRLE
uniref:RNA polymerase II assembly factor Rtp1 C-terminal domain-containing protein n=1 Tax=Ascaris lumbricoides TaxID=6252 RepID=A0A9J2PYW9_ASCLU